MYFNEGRVLNQPHYKDPETRNANATLHTLQATSGSTIDGEPEVRDWKAAKMLDSANNKLQELMQLLYLLSRDPAVPSDARYHVTVAQGEIALLAHVMRKGSEGTDGDPSAQSGGIEQQPARP